MDVGWYASDLRENRICNATIRKLQNNTNNIFHIGSVIEVVMICVGISK